MDHKEEIFNLLNQVVVLYITIYFFNL